MKSINCAALLLAGVSTFAFASLACAQTAAPQAGGDEVVVTGSRVIKNGNNSPTPVTVVNVDDALALQPTTVADALNDLPVFSGQRNQFSNPAGISTAANQGGGNTSGNYLNLRNMGPQRTLVLFDGRRVPSTSINGAVDVDMIPQMLLQRVDIVTGGASAVYGSDAVTGVVNFITDRRFVGLKMQAQMGATQIGDDRSAEAGVAFGKNLFDGRGHFEASYEYRDDEGVLTKLSRPLDAADWTAQGAGTAANPYHLVADAQISTSSFGGLILGPGNTNPATANPTTLAGYSFDQNGVLSPFVHGAATGTANIEMGGDGVHSDYSLKAPLKSHQLFGRFDYDFTDKIHGYAAVAANWKQNYSYVGYYTLTAVTLSSTDAFLAPAYQAQLTAAKQATFNFSKMMQDTGRSRTVTNENQVFFTGGLDGSFLDKYKWEVGFVHSTAHQVQDNLTSTNNGHLYAALDAVKDSSGNVVCNVTITNPGLYPGCVPLNPFGPTSDSAAAMAYIYGDPTQYISNTVMDDVGGSLTGSPFSLWAGQVNAALSGEWRRVGFEGINPNPISLLNCTGLRFNCTATSTAFGNNTAPRPFIAQTVSEGAIEVDAPILKDLPFIQSFDINGAARYTAYSTSGDYWTWKIGADWHVIDSVKLRGTVSRDIRAPTLDDLFAPATANTGGTFLDPLTGLTATNVTTIGGGNPALKAEIGDTKTAGFIFTPPQIPGFSVSIDAFDITVTNALLGLLAQNVTLENACVASQGSSPYCELYVRPLPYSNTTAANNVTAIKNYTINIASQHTEGADIEVNYATRLFDRPVSFRGLTTYQPHLQYIQPGLPTIDQAGAAFGTQGIQASPIWRVSAFVHTSPIDNLNVDFLVRYRDGLNLLSDHTLFSSGPQVAAVTFVNMNISYAIKSSLGQSTLFLNISNLFDQAPPPAAFSGGRTNPGQQTDFVIGDDPLGRAFTVGVRIKH